VVYLVYWGAGEPLGQSLVLPAVKTLADIGVDLTLVTFEKPADGSRCEEMASIRAALHRHGVRWIPIRYHKRPKVPATAFDLLQGCAGGIAARLSARPDIIHARTFVGGLMGLALAPLLRAKLIYHHEGFYPDEQVDAGVWKAGSAPHRMARWLEQRLYARADGIIAMSHRGKANIQSRPAVQQKRTPVIIVPSCVDLNQFRWNPPQRRRQRDELRFVYIGSVGGRYRLDAIGRMVAVARHQVDQVHLRVLTRTEPGRVGSILSSNGLPDDAWSVDCVPHAAIPEELSHHHAGLFFLTQGLSEHGCSPTKIGEYWASGLPVITTPNVSDTDEIVRRERVGVIVNEHSETEYRRAVRELQSLLDDPELSQRCRYAAETHYALRPACERQLALYQHLLARTAPVADSRDYDERVIA
jgi:glycosyltransferase involved in cell wall biosynthesis